MVSFHSQPVNRRSVFFPARDRPHKEKLLQVQIAVEYVPFGQPLCAFQIQRRQHLPCNYGIGDIRRVFSDFFYHAIGQQLTILVPAPVLQAIRHVLYEARS